MWLRTPKSGDPSDAKDGDQVVGGADGIGEEGSFAGSSADLLRGLTSTLAERLKVPGYDQDLGVTIGKYNSEFAGRAGKDFAAFSRQVANGLTRHLGDAQAGHVLEHGEIDGRCDVPGHADPLRPPFVHGLVDSVAVVSAEICEGRQFLDGAIRQHRVVAQTDQSDADDEGKVLHPEAVRWAAWGQRLMILPIVGIALAMTYGLAKSINQWPSRDAGSDHAALGFLTVTYFAPAVVLLGLLAALFSVSQAGRGAMRDMFDIDRPGVPAIAGAAIAGALGLLYSAGGLWHQTPTRGSSLALGLLAWMLLGVVSYAFTFLVISLSQHPRLSEEIAEMFSRYLGRKARQREVQAEEMLKLAGRLHDAMLRETSARASVLIDRYYQINLLARRNSRDATLTEFIRDDIIAARELLVDPMRTPCICDVIEATE